MKAKIHPQLHKVVFLDVMSEAEFVTTSTMKSDEIKKIGGVEHYVIRVETSSASHPFYTGKRRSDIRNDQVAKFMAKVAKAQEKNTPKVVKSSKNEEDGAEPTEKKAKAVKKTTAKKSSTKSKK